MAWWDSMADEGLDLDALTTSQYQALIAESSDVITVVDVTGTIKYQSANSERIKGWPPEALIGENIVEFIHPDDRERVVERFTALLGEVGSIDDEIEFRFRTQDGDYIWLAVTGSAPGTKIPLDGYVTLSRDITKRKGYEKRLLDQRNDLETLNEVLRHDIRNDLQLIEAYAEMLEDHVDDEGREQLKKVQQSTDNAISLTKTAGDLANVLLRPEGDAHIGSVSVKPILSAEFEEVRDMNPEATMTITDPLPAVDVVAGELLSSVFRNLLKNAIQHNDKDHVEIDVSVEVDDETAVVRVADNGPGVRDELKADIFGKGNKGLDSAGTGIGLYLVQTLLDGYGGSVHVEDNDPEGAVFVVELQRADRDDLSTCLPT